MSQSQRVFLDFGALLLALASTALVAGCSSTDPNATEHDAAAGEDADATEGGLCAPGQNNCCVYQQTADGGGAFHCGSSPTEPVPACSSVGLGTSRFDDYCAGTNNKGICVYCRDGVAGVSCSCVKLDGGDHACLGTGSACSGPSQ